MNKRSRITDDVVRYAARLSRLDLDDKEAEMFRGQLADILEYVEQLRKVDTEGIAPTTHVLSSMKNVFREDEPVNSLSPGEALGNAPDKKGDFFRVPRIIKER